MSTGNSNTDGVSGAHCANGADGAIEEIGASTVGVPDSEAFVAQAEAEMEQRITAAIAGLRAVVTRPGGASAVTFDEQFEAQLRGLGADVIEQTTEMVAAGYLTSDKVRQLIDAEYTRRFQDLIRAGERDVLPRLVDVAALGPVDLSGAQDGEEPPAKFPYVQGLILALGTTLIAAEGGVGKTWIGLQACVEAARANGWESGSAIYVDADVNPADSMTTRLRLLGVPDEAIRNRAVSVVRLPALAEMWGHTSDHPEWQALRSVVEGARRRPPKVLVIDSLAAVLATFGGDENSTPDVGRVLQGLIGRVRDLCSVIVLDHVGHEALARPRGSSSKAPAVDEVLQLTALPHRKDAAELTLEVKAGKDRFKSLHYHFAPAGSSGQRFDVGVIEVVKDAHGQFVFEVEPASEAGAREAKNREAKEAALFLKRRAAVQELIEAATPDGGLTKQNIINAMTDEKGPFPQELVPPRDQLREVVTALLDKLHGSGAIEKGKKVGSGFYWVRTPAPQALAASVSEPQVGDDPFVGQPLPDLDGLLAMRVIESAEGAA